MRRDSTIEALCSTWAKAYGCDQGLFVEKLQRAGITHRAGVKISAVDVFKAITFRSEKDEAIARQANAKAEEQEMENAVRRKELMNLAEIERLIWNDLLGPLRQEIEQMPRSLSGLCNPDSPDTAHQALMEWVKALKQKLDNANKGYK